MDLTTLIILAAICFILGIILDNLIHLFISPGESTPRRKMDELLPSPRPPAPIQPPPVPPEDRLSEVAQLWRDLDNHRLAIRMGGLLYRQNQALTPQQASDLTSVVRELSLWLAPASQEAQPQTEMPAPSRAAPPPLPQTPSFDNQEQEKVRPVSMNPVAALVSSLQREVKAPPKPVSLAGQVDEILQEKLVNSPLANRGIRITEAPDSSLIVWVGLEKYSGLDAVTDVEVRQIIQSAVQEWGKRMSASESRTRDERSR